MISNSLRLYAAAGKPLNQVAPCCLKGISRLHASAVVLSDDADILHRSIVPTDHFQRSLPRLPVPKLEDTCRRYLASLHPLLSAQEHQRTEGVVRAFQEGEGKALQEALVTWDKANKHTNYISDSWFEMYLKDRRPLVLTHNPYICFTDESRKEYNSQLIRSTNFIISSMRLMKTMRANILEPEVYHLNPEKSDNKRFRRFVSLLPKAVSWYGAYWYMAFPLDMSQYGRLFNSTRIPRPGKDELYTDTTARHIVVIRNGHHYVFDVLDRNGSIVPAEQIMAHLQHVLADNSAPSPHPIGVLTAEHRDVWTRARQQLVDAGNAETLKLIDGAVFALSLEDSTTDEPNQLSRLFLYGDAANKWFDKSFTVMMTRTGLTALNFEHAWGDGVAVMRYMNEVFADTTKNPRVSAGTKPSCTVDSSTAVRKLEWQLTDEIKKTVQDAKARYEESTSKLDIAYLQSFKFGKKFLKKNKLSPDSFMQLAFQMAFSKQYGKTVATYESCSTAAFKHGRTETIRPATTATKRACDLFASPHKSTAAELRQSLEQCSTVHGQLTKEAAMGQGFDRHLLGLKQTAERGGGKMPDFYKDPAYSLINHNIISTSTLSSPAIQIGGFAPVVPDGYGIGYAAEDDFLGCNVSCYPPARNVSDFLQCIQSSLDDMHAVLEGRLPAAK